jgi:hypothetical protein
VLAGRAGSGYWLVNGLVNELVNELINGLVSKAGFDPDLPQFPLPLQQ